MRHIFNILFLYCLLIGCQSTPKFSSMKGQTMGTTYSVTLASNIDTDQIQIKIDSLLDAINRSVNHYDPSSLLESFNRSVASSAFAVDDPYAVHLYRNVMAARRVFTETQSHFDPTVGPLVNYFGFGTTGKYNLNRIDSTKVDSIMKYVSMNRVLVNKSNNQFIIEKSDPRIQMDFSAIAKGYAVDQIGLLLESFGIENYFVEIGGEVRCSGKNPSETPWNIGINDPKIDAALNQTAKVVQFTDRSMASSGNYRNYYKVGKQTLAHTINPLTGFPEANDLLSATILHEECMYADAYATACMVMGLEKAVQFVSTHPEISYLFLYADQEGSIQSVDSGDLTFLD